MKRSLLFLTPLLCLLMVQAASANTAEDFTGAYAPDKWTVSLPESEYGGAVIFDGTTTLIIEGPEGEECSGGREVIASVVVDHPGQIGFDFIIENFDADGTGYDFFIVRKTADGSTEVLVDLSISDTGEFSAHFDAGDTMELVVYSVDCIEGELVATISNFYYPVYQVPLSWLALSLSFLLIAGFSVFSIRRKSS